jgi:hypothetical protein
MLRWYAVGMTLFTGVMLLGAVREATREVTFDTITVHRINVIDRERRRAMIITDHDDFPPPIVNGKVFNRSGGNDSNGIVFYNQRGDEQGALTWAGRRYPNGTFESENEISFDTVNTDQLIHVQDGNVNGKTFSEVIGWNQADYDRPDWETLIRQAEALRSNPTALKAFVAAHPWLVSKTRYMLGYGLDNTSQVMLADGDGRPRIKMYVTAGGQAELQFLDASGNVVAEYPQSH